LKNNVKDTQQPINEAIKASSLQVIGETGENLGTISRSEALRLAREASLDLVLLSPEGGEGLPVAKIMDFGKVLYAKKKKQSEAKKRQKVIQIKEIKMRPKIGEHDFQTKLKHGVSFLQDGNKLKITLMFRGREITTKEERGAEFFDKIVATLKEMGMDNLIMEKDSITGGFWSRIFSTKNIK